jgi:hypothetical protein
LLEETEATEASGFEPVDLEKELEALTVPPADPPSDLREEGGLLEELESPVDVP